MCLCMQEGVPKVSVPCGSRDDGPHLPFIVKPELSDENAAFHRFVYDPVLRIDSARPVSTEGVCKRFWLTNTRMRIPDDIV